MIYVDKLRKYQNKKGLYAHMVSDKGPYELHYFAEQLNINRCWFDSNIKHPHYDLNEVNYHKAIKHGAKVVTSKELVRIIKQCMV